MTETDVQHHIHKLLDGEISAYELAALETELLENPEAMETYREFLDLHCALEDEIDNAQAVKTQSVIPIDRLLALQRKFIIKVSLMGAAAILLLSALAMWYFQTPDQQPPLAKFQTAPGSDFTLTHDGESKPPIGDYNTMAEGSRLVLRHGVAELKLPHDVRAVVEAPAEMVLRDDRTLELTYGRALFQITTEEGQGFTVVTPHQRIVDLGTSFGIDSIKGRKEIELHVLEGQVRVDGIDGKHGKTIKANRAVMLAGTRVSREIDPSSVGFLNKLPPKIDTLVKTNFANGLLTGQNYVIRMDPSVIRDLAGNRFRGINDDTTWNFTTTPPATVPVPVVSYVYNRKPGRPDPGPFADSGNVKLTDGILGSDVSIFTESSGVRAEGDSTSTMVGWNAQPITSEITFDLGRDRKASSIIVYGETQYGAGASQPDSVTVSVSSDNLTYSTPEAVDLSFSNDSGIRSRATLDISPWGETRYYRLAFSNADTNWMMLSEIRFTSSSTETPITEARDLEKNHPVLAPTPALSDHDDLSPTLMALYPADDSTSATPGGQLKMLFNEPIKFGTGRVFIQKVTNWDENLLVVGDHRLSIDGRVLTINPPIQLKDGAQSMGWLAGWQSPAPVTFLNPRGDGKWYNNDDLQDDRKSHGMIESMRNPGMTSINKPIRREVGTITPGSRYTVSAGIGVRADDAKVKSTYLGYTIRLVSGDTVLAQLTSNSPPGRANSVNTVGFSWETTSMPKDVHYGDPLTIEITPNEANGLESGYLDLNALRISVLGETGR